MYHCCNRGVGGGGAQERQVCRLLQYIGFISNFLRTAKMVLDNKGKTILI